MAILRPASDIITGGWSSTGASLYTEIDETSASNADYISSSTTGQKCQIALGTTTDPGNDNNHVLRYQAESDGDRGLIVRVLETGQPPALILKRDICKSQPQVFFGLKNSVISALNVGVFNTIKDTKLPVISGSASRYAGGYSLPSAGSYLTVSNSAIDISAPFTIVLVFTTGSSVNNQTILASSSNAIGARTIRIMIASSTTLQFLIGGEDGSWTDDTVSIGTTLQAKTTYTLVARFKKTTTFSGNKNILIAGKVVTFSSFESRYPRAPVALRFGREAELTGYDFNGYLHGYACINKYVSDSECFSLSNNPWQIFKPKSHPIFIDAPKVIATQTKTAGEIGASYNGTIALTSGEAANITNYANLVVELEST